MKYNKEDIPEPKLGGAYIHCPHFTTETVKVARKKPTFVHTFCKFKTKRIRRYRRHYVRRHIDHPTSTASVANLDAKIDEARAARKPTPRYAKGDSRRNK